MQFKIEWLELNTFYPHPPKQSKELLIVGHIIDITQKKKQYEILRKENESIQNVLHMMAHDLKQPLTQIGLVIGILESMLAKEDIKKVEKYLNTLKETSKNSENLIDKLLNLATLKGETTKMDLDLQDIRVTIKDVLKSLKIQLEKKRISVNYYFPDYSVEVLLDEQLFKQVIENLINNALKFTADHGKISLKLSYVKDSIQLSIEDNGIGIPEEHLPNLFEGISPIKRPGLKGEPSTGLGLYICKQIITIHKGKIFAENNGSGGTSFIIILPKPIPSSAYY